MFYRTVPELCKPDVRAYMEKQCNQIAAGQASKEEVMNYNIKLFRDNFFKFEQGLDRVKHLLVPREMADSFQLQISNNGHYGYSKGGGGGYQNNNYN